MFWNICDQQFNAWIGGLELAHAPASVPPPNQHPSSGVHEGWWAGKGRLSWFPFPRHFYRTSPVASPPPGVRHHQPCCGSPGIRATLQKFYYNSIGLLISLIFSRLAIVMIFLLIICYDVKKFTFFLWVYGFFFVFSWKWGVFPLEAHVRWNDEQQPSRKPQDAWEELSEW